METIKAKDVTTGDAIRNPMNGKWSCVTANVDERGLRRIETDGGHFILREDEPVDTCHNTTRGMAWRMNRCLDK